MVRAILEGRKTQTRRIMKRKFPHGEPVGATASLGGWPVHFPDGKWDNEWCPYGQPGDRLWVRETICYSENGCVYEYGADGKTVIDEALEWRALWAYEGRAVIPSIHMPRAASRILLEITEIRGERLGDISKEDAIAEGIEPLFSPAEIAERPELGAASGWKNYMWHGDLLAPAKYVDQWPYQYSNYDDPRQSFASLWARINGPESVALNPWVWAISFQRSALLAETGERGL